MGHGLYATEPVFRRAVDACAAVALDLGHAEADWLRTGNVPRPVARHATSGNQITQVGIQQLALCDLWISAGITPDATLAMSVGEIAASYAAGALTREEAVAVLCAIADEVPEHAPDGVVVSVRSDTAGARDLCARAPRPLSLCGSLEVNLANLSMAARDTAENIAFLEAEDCLESSRQTIHPHQAQANPVSLAEIERRLSDLRPRRPAIPCFWAVGGRDVQDDLTADGNYWHWMLSHTYLLGDAMIAAVTAGPAVVVDISVRPFFRDRSEGPRRRPAWKRRG